MREIAESYLDQVVDEFNATADNGPKVKPGTGTRQYRQIQLRKNFRIHYEFCLHPGHTGIELHVEPAEGLQSPIDPHQGLKCRLKNDFHGKELLRTEAAILTIEYKETMPHAIKRSGLIVKVVSTDPALAARAMHALIKLTEYSVAQAISLAMV